MKVQAPVKQETSKIAIGVIILAVLMVIVFVVMGQFDLTVLWGTIYGSAYAVLNFFLMALTVQQAAEKMNGVHLPPEEEIEDGTEADEKQEQPLSPEAQSGRRLMQTSYTLRMFLLIAVVVIALAVPFINALPAVIAMIFPRIVIFFEPFMQKFRKGD